MKMKTDDRIGYAHADKLLLPNNLLLRELEEMLADERTVMLKTKGDSMLPLYRWRSGQCTYSATVRNKVIANRADCSGALAGQPVCAAPYRPYPWNGGHSDGRWQLP